MGDGLKWATTNVGGFYPEDYGDYFAWGEFTPKEDYSWSTYKWGTSSTLTRYVTDEDYGTVDNQTQLLRSRFYPDDAAFANWGASWRMPTYEEWGWLRNNCTWEWTTENGVNGWKATSNTTGNSIFLPAAGFRKNSSLLNDGSYGYYWSSSLSTAGVPLLAWGLDFYSGYVGRGDDFRYYGRSVRPVSD